MKWRWRQRQNHKLIEWHITITTAIIIITIVSSCAIYDQQSYSHPPIEKASGHGTIPPKPPRGRLCINTHWAGISVLQLPGHKRWSPLSPSHPSSPSPSPSSSPSPWLSPGIGPNDGGSYSCFPGDLPPSNITVHVLKGKPNTYVQLHIVVWLWC